MLKKREEFGAMIERLFPQKRPDGNPKTVLSYTLQITTDCSLRCSYCYQINKSKHMMSFDVAKSAIDELFSKSMEDDGVFSTNNISGIVIEFIGGEPLLNIDLIKSVIGYCEERFIEEAHPWLFTHKYSIVTNGVAYFDDRFQKLLSDYKEIISVGVTVDGYKDLHDKCRLFPDGSGSYDLAIRASLDQLRRFGNDSTKITLCPENIGDTATAVENMLSLGYKHVFANCVFEEGWNVSHARILYEQMKKIADYILDKDLEDKCNVSLFSEDSFRPIDVSYDDKNWCGGTGSMVAVDWRGFYYPCLRYMESSLGEDAKPIIVGNTQDGIYETEESKKILQFLKSITRTSQSTEECNNCEIAQGCAWCSAYNYQKFGTPNRRATFICPMHKARALGSYYYFKNEAKKNNKECIAENHLKKEKALEIIEEEEWNLLNA